MLIIVKRTLLYHHHQLRAYYVYLSEFYSYSEAELTASELVSFTRQWISLWSGLGNKSLFYQLHAPDFIDCSSADRGSDRDSFYSGIEKFLAAFPGIETTIEDIIAEPASGKVAVRWKALGINTKCYLGVGPTNCPTAITGIEIIIIQSGCITHRWGEWDITGHFRNAQQE